MSVKEIVLLRANVRGLRKNRLHAVPFDVARELVESGVAEVPEFHP